jgi:hypothetical protein
MTTPITPANPVKRRRITGRPAGRPPKLPPLQAAQYAIWRKKYPDISRRDLARMCGYADGYSPPESTQARAISIDQIRDHLQRESIYTFKDNVQVLKDIQDNDKEHASDRINAIKTGNAMMGFNAPQTINTNNKSLFVELTGLSIDQLKALESISVDNENS